MTRYVVKRLLLAVPTLLGITIVTFAVVRLAPGDPAAMQLDGTPGGDSARLHEQLRAYWRLDQPLHRQYAGWLARLVTFDFGHSFVDHRPVWDKIAEKLPWTVGLAVASLGATLALAIPIGVIMAVRAGGWFDRITGVGLYAAFSVPNYVAAGALIAAVAVIPIDWLPISGAISDDYDGLSVGGRIADVVRHALLIGICYSYPALAYQARFVRNNMLETLRQDYVRTARANGLSRCRVIFRHAFRNTWVPLITLLGLTIPSVVSGSVILEVMFNWPGIGRLFYASIAQRDYPTVMALSVVSAVLVLLSTLAADIACARADPRIHDAQ
ncbi:MAG: ABC transporter permease [Phycisphaerales bacterium]|nr:ABC transporter permease [Phycisphaerales bacterium]